MQINYLGHSCFKLKGKNSVLVTDPFSKSIGYSLPKTEANIVTISHDHFDHNDLENISGNPFVIRAPGEYEIADVSVFGWRTFHDSTQGSQRGSNTIYAIHLEGITLLHLGDLGHKLDDRQLEEVNGVDVLFVPVGNIYSLSPKQAVEVVNQIEPKIVIPMHYAESGKTIEGLASLEDFLKEIGSQEVISQPKLILNKLTLSEERIVAPMLRK